MGRSSPFFLRFQCFRKKNSKKKQQCIFVLWSSPSEYVKQSVSHSTRPLRDERVPQGTLPRPPPKWWCSWLAETYSATGSYSPGPVARSLSQISYDSHFFDGELAGLSSNNAPHSP